MRNDDSYDLIRFYRNFINNLEKESNHYKDVQALEEIQEILFTLIKNENPSITNIKKQLQKIRTNYEQEESDENDLIAANGIKEDIQLFLEDDTTIYLGKLIGSGAEGNIYRVSSMPGKLAKIYRRRKDMVEREAKLQTFLDANIASEIDDEKVLCIPKHIVYTSKHEFIGFIMDEIAIDKMIYDMFRSNKLNYKDKIAIAYNLAEVFAYIHEHHMIIGDINFNNICVQENGQIVMIDVDSFTITNDKTNITYHCPVTNLEVAAPEIQMIDGEVKGFLTTESDDFALANMIFRLLMNGANPFGFVSKDKMYSHAFVTNYDKNIATGCCVYVKDIEHKQIPEWAPDFQMLSDEIKTLFKRAFDYDEHTFQERIKNRPTAKEWKEALLHFYQLPMKQCKKDPLHFYRKELDVCPFCKK